MHLSAKPPQRLDLPDASPSRPVEDYDLDRREVQARQRAEPTRTNQPCGLIVHSFFQSGNTILVLWLYNEASLALRNTVSPGGHGGEVIPVPIPNTEVKSPSGEGTAGVARGRVARRQAFSPEPRASQSRGALFFETGNLKTGNCRAAEGADQDGHIRESASMSGPGLALGSRGSALALFHTAGAEPRAPRGVPWRPPATETARAAEGADQD